MTNNSLGLNTLIASTDFAGISITDTVENRLKQIPYNKRSMETLLNVIAETYNCNIMLLQKRSVEPSAKALKKNSGPNCPKDGLYIDVKYKPFLL